MNELLLGAAMLMATMGAAPALERPGEAVLPPTFAFDAFPESRSRRPAGDLLVEWSGPVRERAWGHSAQAARGKRSRVDRIIALAAGVSIGWMVGGGIGFAVTPKRGPHDDTSGLKGMMIGAPIGAAAGALIGWQLTK